MVLNLSHYTNIAEIYRSRIKLMLDLYDLQMPYRIDFTVLTIPLFLLIFALHYEVYGSLSDSSVSSVIESLYGPVPALLTAAT